MKSVLLLGAIVVLFPQPALAQTAADSAAIYATALDYIEGWYEGDAERMEQALHPELAKRILMENRNEPGKHFMHMDATQLVESTRRGGGSSTPVDEQIKDVRILDIFRESASVRVDAQSWVDYLHIAKSEDAEWRIVNVLWELRAER